MSDRLGDYLEADLDHARTQVHMLTRALACVLVQHGSQRFDTTVLTRVPRDPQIVIRQGPAGVNGDEELWIELGEKP